MRSTTAGKVGTLPTLIFWITGSPHASPRHTITIGLHHGSIHPDRLSTGNRYTGKATSHRLNNFGA